MQTLVDATRRKASALIAGLDPVPSRFPPELRDLSEVFATREFCRGILEAVEPYAAAIKLQAAFFERLAGRGATLRRPRRGRLALACRSSGCEARRQGPVAETTRSAPASTATTASRQP